MNSVHLVSIDIMHEHEWTKEVEDEFRDGFHKNLERIKRCHIWHGQTFCFCVNGHSKEGPPSHKAMADKGGF